jgi:hypothetical protein
MSATEKQRKYWALQDLAQRCPEIVNGVKITGYTRLLLWCLAAHCDGYSNSTWVKVRTTMPNGFLYIAQVASTTEVAR